MLLCRADRQPDPDKLSDNALGVRTSPTLLCEHADTPYGTIGACMHGKVLEMHLEYLIEKNNFTTLQGESSLFQKSDRSH